MYYYEEGAVEPLTLSNVNDENERSWRISVYIAVDKQDMLKLSSGEMKEVNSTWYSTGSEFSVLTFHLLFLSLSLLVQNYIH